MKNVFRYIRIALLVALVMTLSSCQAFMELLGLSGSDPAADAVADDWNNGSDPTISPYPLIGNRPVPGNGGELALTYNSNEETIQVTFTAGTDIETSVSRLEYIVLATYSPDFRTDDDVRFWANQYVQDYGYSWQTISGSEATSQFSSITEPLYFNVGVRDSDGNVAAYQMEFWMPPVESATYTIGGSYDVSSETVTLSGLSSKDVFVVLTNTDNVDTGIVSSPGLATVNSSPLSGSFASVHSPPLPSTIMAPATASTTFPVGMRGFPGQHDPKWAIPDPVFHAGSTVTARNYAEGDHETLYAYSSSASGNIIPVPATLATATNDGIRSLYIWIDSSNTYDITKEMIDQLAERFLITGSSNDIYDWDTGVFGAPWGTHSASGYIPADSQDIHILLYDIDDDGIPSDGARTAGFFWSKDNIAGSADSNQRLMFYMDSALFSACEGAAWDLTDYWPSVIVSTLAHEFQHMINFYQRYILRGAYPDDWENEMASLVAEDLVTKNLGIPGPRGVSSEYYTEYGGDAGGGRNWRGRIAEYNYAWNTRLDTWDSSNPLPDYSASYAFGSFLLRRYGAEVMTFLLQENTPNGQTAVLDAVQQTASADPSSFDELVRQWGVAAFVSNDSTTTGADFAVNQGEWISTSTNGLSFDIGSINYHNYEYYYNQSASQVGPRIYDSATIQSVSMAPHTNAFVLVAEDASSVTLNFSTLSPGLVATVILRD